MNLPHPDTRTLSARASKVILAAILVTAVSGYFMGLHQTRAARAESGRDGDAGRADRSSSAVTVSVSASASGAQADGIREVVDYARLGETPWKPNAGWGSRLDQLQRVPGVAAVGGGSLPPAPASDSERSLAVELRAGRRAFEGAPPVIPHPVDPLAPDNCRACHQDGLAVRGVVARRMSHGEIGSCIQCHVPQRGPGPAGAGELPMPYAENGFAGMGSAGRGSRVWPGAPPTIPHTLWMRQDCASCHGAGGLDGLRTSHPERVLCLQCHVPDGAADLPPWLRTDLAQAPDPVAGRPGP